MKVPTTKWTLLAFFSLAVMIQLTDTSIRSGDDVKPKFDGDSGGFNFLFGKLDVKNQADDLVEHREKRAKTPKTPEAKDVEIKFGGQTIKIGESLEKNTKSCKDKTTFADLIKCVKGPVETIQKEVFTAITTECSKKTEKDKIKCSENALAKYKKTATDVIFALFKSMCSNTDKNKKSKCEKDLESSAKGMLANAIHPELKKLLETPTPTLAPTGKGKTQAAPKVTPKAAAASTTNPTKPSKKPKEQATPAPVPPPATVEPKVFTSVDLIEHCKNKQDFVGCVKDQKEKLLGLACPPADDDCQIIALDKTSSTHVVAKIAFEAKVCALDGGSCKDEEKKAFDKIAAELKKHCKAQDTKCTEEAEKEARKALDSLLDSIPLDCSKNPKDRRCSTDPGFSSVNLINKCKEKKTVNEYNGCLNKEKTKDRTAWEKNCGKITTSDHCKNEGERMEKAAVEGAKVAYAAKKACADNKDCKNMSNKAVSKIAKELESNCKKEAKCLKSLGGMAQKAVDSLVDTIPLDCSKNPKDRRCPTTPGFSSVDLITKCKMEKDKSKYDNCVVKTKDRSVWENKCKGITTSDYCEIEGKRMAEAAVKVAKAAYAAKEACAANNQSNCDAQQKAAIKATTDELIFNCRGNQTCIKGAGIEAQGVVTALVATIPTTTAATSPEPVTKPVVPSSTPASVSTTSPIEDDEDSYDGMTCMTHRKELNEMHCGLCDELFKAGPRSETDFWEVVTIGLWITFAILSTAAIVFAIYDWRCRRRYAKELKRLRAENAERKLKAAYAKAAAAKKDLPKEEPSPAIPSPPADRNSAHRRMRAKLLETQANLRKLRDHVKKTTAQHKSDARSKKFKKMGPIYIPMEPEITPSAPIPDNIKLENVEYDPTGNEMYDIGSDVDDIELDKSLTVDEDDSEEESKKSKKKTSKKSNKKTSKDGKTGSKTGSKTETDKKDDKKGSKETPESKESGGTPKQATPSGSGSEPKTPESKSKSKEKP